MRIVLAEDSTLLREGLAQLLGAAGHDVRTAADARGLSELFTEARPDLVISDVRMPPRMADDGLATVHRLRADEVAAGGTPTPAVILSQYVAAAYLDSLLEHGSFGYLLKERVGDVEEFLRSLETVAAGGSVVDPEVVTSLLRNRSSGVAALTEREREVLGLMAEGLSNSEISARLFLSAGAVSKHVAAVFMKLGFAPSDENRRVRAVLEWLRHAPG